MPDLSKHIAILSLLTSVALVSASSSHGIAVDLPRRQDDCNAVHLFLARGNNEPYPGRQQAMVQAVCDGVSNCGYEDLIYSALYTDLSCQTAYDAVHAAYAQVSQYACRCPDAKLVLTGYSQGGNIYTDFLGGGGGELFNECIQPETPALDRKTFPGNRIDAVVVFGDTRHTANQTYNVGGGSGINGIFPRPDSQLEALKDWTDILYSYCGANDPVCAAGQDKNNYNVTQHLTYYDTHAGEAAAWIKKVAKIEDNDPGFVTQVPTSLSGTAQEYSTIATNYVPSGTVASVPISTATCSTTSKASSTRTSSTHTSLTHVSSTHMSSTQTPSTRMTESISESTSANAESASALTTATSSTAAESTTEDSTTSDTETSAATAETTASDDGATSRGSIGLLGSFFLAAAAVL